MRIELHKSFEKRYAKLSPKLKKKFKERRSLFLKDPHHPLLNNHQLQGKLIGYRSINITGDVRVHYQEVYEDTALFITIGTHPELYG